MKKTTLLFIALFAAMFVSASYGATLTENFEETAWGGASYSKRTITVTTGSWIVSGVGNMDDNDRRNDTRSIRFRGGNANDTNDNLNRVEMNFDKTGGIGTVSFKYASYSGHSGGILNVEYSTNQGSTWILAGSTEAAPTWVNGGSVMLNASIPVNVDGSARIRVTKTFVGSGSISANIDDLVITDFSGVSTKVKTPTFSPASGIYTAPLSVIISNETEGAAIFYTTDGSEPTASSTPYTTPISVSTTTVVKAIATKAGLDNSTVATATYTFPVDVANIAAFNALAVNTVAKITGTITVVYQNGSNLFVQDASGWLLIYGSAGKTYQSGDQLTNVTGSLLMYGTAPADFPELVLISGIALPDGVAGTPATAAVVTPASLTNADLNRYVSFENVEIAANVTYATTGDIEDGTIVNGAGTMIIRHNYKLIGATFNAGDKVNIKGIVRTYSNEIQIYVLSIGKVTGIDKPQNNIAKIYPLDGNVIVVSEKAQRVEIYNTLGQKLVSRNVNAGTNSIPVSARGILFVKMGDKTSKILVK